MRARVRARVRLPPGPHAGHHHHCQDHELSLMRTAAGKKEEEVRRQRRSKGLSERGGLVAKCAPR